MPTGPEWTELINNCTWSWTTQNGINGGLGTGPNGNSIFLPAAGYRNVTDLNNVGSDGYYWSSSLETDHYWNSTLCWDYYSSDAWYGGCVSYRNDDMGNGERCLGFSVRPVSE